MKMKTTLCAAALLALASPAFAALTYSYSVAPGFSGGSGLYLDDIAGTTRGQLNTPFASGDLTDGVIAHDNWEPLKDYWPGLVAWDPTPLASTITIDLGTLTNVSAIDITTFAWSAFALGAPTGVTIDYSTTTTFAGPGTYHAFTDGGDNAVSHAGEVTTSASGVRFIQLAFDGTSTKSKWALTEIGVSITDDPFNADPKLIAGTGLDFGRLPANSDPVDASLALQNDGATNALDISGVTVTGANATNFSITAHPATLAPGGGTGNIDVSFNPHGSDGKFTAQLEINSNDPVNPTVTVPLVALVSPAFAALTYSYSVAPGFSGGAGLYLDDIAGTTRGQLNTPFASGDLTDGVIAHANWEPLKDYWPGLVAWDPVPLASTITIDLGAVSDVSAIDITTFAWSAFGLGAPTGVTIDYSTTTTFAGEGTYHAFTDGGDNAVSHAGEVTTSASGVQFIQLSFDGTSTKGKWALTEIDVSFATGGVIPEPSSSLLGLLGLVGMVLRRRR